MALGSLNVRVSKADFEARINTIEQKIAMLVDVIDRYGRAKENLDQFIESNDSNYQAMIERIDENIKAAKKAHASLVETKNTLQTTVDQMNVFGTEVKETLTSAVDATKSTVEAVLKIDAIL